MEWEISPVWQKQKRMTGHFDNKDQFNKMQAEGKTYPYAEHVNTIGNDKINNLCIFVILCGANFCLLCSSHLGGTAIE